MTEEQLKKIQQIKGGNRPDEYMRLNYLASQVTEGVIVEIGAWQGKSACFMAMDSKVPIYSIDKWDLRDSMHGESKLFSHPDNYEAYKANIKSIGADKQCIPIKGLSKEIAKAWNRDIGLLIIDGDHRYRSCMDDYQGFAKYIIPGGYIAFHDYDPSRPGVIYAVNGIMKSPVWTDWQQTNRLITARRV